MKRFYLASIVVLSLIVVFDLPSIAAQNSDKVKHISWSPDGRLVAIVNSDNLIRLWSEQNTQQLLVLAGHQDKIGDLAWSPTGTKLVTISNDRTARVWNVITLTSILTIEGLGRSSTRVEWSPDGKTIASSYFEGFDNLTLRDAITGKIGQTATVQSPLQMGWSNDGTRFAILLGTIYIWDGAFTKSESVPTARVVSDFSTGFAWHPTANLLVLGTASATIQLIDAVKLVHVAEYKTTDATVNADDPMLLNADDPYAYATINVAFSADGSEIMSVNADGTVRKWEVATGEMISSAHIDVAKTTYTPYPIVDWSPYRGRMIYLSDDTPTDASSETDLAALGVKIVTPFASDEQLRSLVNLCVAEAAAKTTLASLIAEKNYPELVTTVKALSAEQIPPACAADVAAVAAAMGEKRAS